MKQVVYVDVLFALNMIISFLMIKAVCRLSRESPSTVRVLIGSVLGAVYSLSIFLPPLNTVLLIFVRIVFLCAVCCCVFGFGSFRRFLRCFGLLIAVTFLFAGLVIGVWIVFKPQSMLLRNGSVYFDIGFVPLVLSCAALYCAVWLFSRFLFKNSREKLQASVIITFKGKTVKAKGIIDTGNTLTDSFTGKKVSVIDQTLALELLPSEYAAAAIDPMKTEMPQGMHLIVSDTVGGTVLMCAFTVDKLIVSTDDKTVITADAAVAVSTQTRFGNGCCILLNADILTGGREYGKKTEGVAEKASGKAERAGYTLHKRSRNLACSSDCSAGEGGDAADRAGR